MDDSYEPSAADLLNKVTKENEAIEGAQKGGGKRNKKDRKKAEKKMKMEEKVNER